MNTTARRLFARLKPTWRDAAVAVITTWAIVGVKYLLAAFDVQW
jgi:hypothetical protein